MREVETLDRCRVAPLFDNGCGFTAARPRTSWYMGATGGHRVSPLSFSAAGARGDNSCRGTIRPHSTGSLDDIADVLSLNAQLDERHRSRPTSDRQADRNGERSGRRTAAVSRTITLPQGDRNHEAKPSRDADAWSEPTKPASTPLQVPIVRLSRIGLRLAHGIFDGGDNRLAGGFETTSNRSRNRYARSHDVRRLTHGISKSPHY